MKRTFLAALTASMLLFGLPSVASAHHGKHHASCTRRHHAKCARAHVLRFGPSTTAPASSPTTPTTETAGMVKSFITPVLTITLNDKTEVSGKVTEGTRIECESATPTGGGDEGDDDGGGGGGGGGDSAIGVASHGDWMTASGATSEDDQGQGDDQGDDDGNIQPCTASALTAGATVRSAELVLGGEGAVWEKVVLVS